MIPIEWMTLLPMILGGGTIGILIQQYVQRKNDKETNELKALELQMKQTEKEREDNRIKDEVIEKLRQELWETKRALAKAEHEKTLKDSTIRELKEHVQKLEEIIEEFEGKASDVKGEYENGSI